MIHAAVSVAQLVEHRSVAPRVAGSNPVAHPRKFLAAIPQNLFRGGQNRRRSARCAAKYPHIPCTPGPGGAADEQRNAPGKTVE